MERSVKSYMAGEHPEHETMHDEQWRQLQKSKEGALSRYKPLRDRALELDTRWAISILFQDSALSRWEGLGRHHLHPALNCFICDLLTGILSLGAKKLKGSATLRRPYRYFRRYRPSFKITLIARDVDSVELGARELLSHLDHIYPKWVTDRFKVTVEVVQDLSDSDLALHPARMLGDTQRASRELAEQSPE